MYIYTNNTRRKSKVDVKKLISEVYSELSHKSKIFFFAKRINAFQPLTTFAKKLHLACLHNCLKTCLM